MKLIATVKIHHIMKRHPEKMQGRCPLKSISTCTDIEGKHHSFLMEADTLKEAKEMVKLWGDASGFRLTRLEVLG